MTTMDIYHKNSYKVDPEQNITLGGQGKQQKTQPTVHKNNHVEIKNHNSLNNN